MPKQTNQFFILARFLVSHGNRKNWSNKSVITIIGVIAAATILVFSFIKIGGVTRITPMTQGPVRVMAQEISSGGCSVSNKVEFNKGTEIHSHTIALKTGRTKGGVKFCCKGDESKICKGYAFPEDKFDCEKGVLKTKQDVTGKIRACWARAVIKPCTIGFKP